MRANVATIRTLTGCRPICMPADLATHALVILRALIQHKGMLFMCNNNHVLSKRSRISGHDYRCISDIAVSVHIISIHITQRKGAVIVQQRRDSRIVNAAYHVDAVHPGILGSVEHIASLELCHQLRTADHIQTAIQPDVTLHIQFTAAGVDSSFSPASGGSQPAGKAQRTVVQGYGIHIKIGVITVADHVDHRIARDLQRTAAHLQGLTASAG